MLRSLSALFILFSFSFLNSAQAQSTAVVTHHYDSGRTGWDQTETQLTQQSVAHQFAALATVYLDDQVDAQPLVSPNQAISGYSGTFQVVYVATENNTVYAINAANGAILRQRNFGSPVPAPLGCDNNGPNVGINGTPVINYANNTLNFIVYTLQNGSPAYVLHSVSLTSLTDVIKPVTVVASNKLKDNVTVFSFNATYQRQRPALLLNNGVIYAAFGSFCDYAGNNSRGWLLGWQASNLAPLPANELTDRLVTSPVNFFLSSIWMSGAGPAADTTGNLYFSTGNSDGRSYDGIYNIQESVVKFSPALSGVASLFTPSNYAALDNADNEVGSGGILAIPTNAAASPPLIVAGGKDGRMFVLNSNSLGGYASGGAPDNVLFEQTIGTGCWCAPSYFMGPDGTGRIVTSEGSTVTSWTIKQTSSSTNIVQEASTQVPESDQDPGFFTTISSNGTQAGTAVIWFVGHEATPPSYPVYLYAVAASNGGLTPIGQYPAGSWPNIGGNANIVPVVADGKVFVATNQQLMIFGLDPQSQGVGLPQGGGLHNVVISSLSYNYATGIFTSVVTNQGQAAIPPGVILGVAYYVDGQKVTFGAVNDPLAPGASVTIGTGAGGSPYFIPAGAHVITAFADDVNRFAESDKTNNELSYMITPTGTLPDLVPTSLSYDPTIGYFTCMVQNQGAGVTPPNVPIGVAYSVDGQKVTWGIASAALASQGLGVAGQLAPGASVSIGTGGGQYFIPPGTHTIAVLADDVDRMAESTRSNNSLSQTITVPTAASTTLRALNTAAPNVGTPNQITGILMKIEGPQLTVKSRMGATVLIDDTESVQAKKVSGLIIGAPITVKGMRDASGQLRAATIYKAKHSINAWPEDQF
jgi:CARDB